MFRGIVWIIYFCAIFRAAQGGAAMGNFFAELKHRHIYRVAAAYAVVAWVLLQLFNNLEPILKLPGWAGTLVLVFLVGGLPVALLLAWVRELGPADGATARATTGKLDWVLIGALVAVIALVSYQQLAPVTGTKPAQPAAVATAASPTSPAQPGGISIAVLPFLNLSSDKEQEFFSDGMTEEITSALAKVPGWLVVGRTSAFQFKGQNKDLTAIAQALHATHLIEGSVRKDRNEVRITAQLIKAADGTHLWTDSYNRELKGVFALQEEIASAIAAALQVPLGLKQGETLVSSRTSDTESYQQYLRAMALYRAGGSGDRVATAMEAVVAQDPSFASGWALLAKAYNDKFGGTPAARSGSVEVTRRLADTWSPKAEAAARRAIALDPNLADGYFALGIVQVRRAKLLLADELFSKGLALDPNNSTGLNFQRNLLAGVGRLKEAGVMTQKLQALEPFAPGINSNTSTFLWVNGQTDSAIALARDLPQTYPFRTMELARFYASMGRYSEATDTLLATPSGVYLPQIVPEAARLLRTAPAKAASPQTLPGLGEFEWVYTHIGAFDRVLDFYEGRIEAENFATISNARLWHPSYAPVRKTERFKAYVRKASLVDYWRARGWPDLCRPMGADDFACD